MYAIKNINTLKNKRQNQESIHSAQIGRLKGKGQAIHHLVHRIQKLAPSQLSILIQGETGSGKELCAQALHQYSTRRDQQLISVNCAAIPSDLLSAELFGSESHAYTGATLRKGLIKSASGGTLFLDEVADLSLSAQAAMLRVLESGELRALGSDQITKVDIRLICASHKDIHQLVNEGKFRADLYHRMTGAILYLPPLRERLEDLADLIFEFSPQVFTRLQFCAWSKLKDFAWPGNIRQLKNIIQCLEVECTHSMILAEAIPLPQHGPWRTLDNDHLPIHHSCDAKSKHLFQAKGDKFLVTGSRNQRSTPPKSPDSSAMTLSISAQNNHDPNLPLHHLSPHQVFTLLPPLSLDAFKESYVHFTVEKNRGNITRSAQELEVSRCLIYRVLQAQQKKVA